MGEFPNQRNNLEPSKLEKLRAASAKVKMVRASNDKAFLRVAILLGIAALGLAVLKLTTLERTSPRFREPRVLVKTVDDLVASKPGERRVLVIEGVDFAFRYCPPGEFEMGADEKFLSNNRHKATLTQGFWLMETELTRGQWSAIMKTRVPGDKERPMESLSWNECQEFVDKINSIRNPASERWNFSLPTEAQWEYACRAGTTDDYYGELDEIAWYCKNEGRKTHRVGLKKPNPWGFYDMIGNVDEWCRDWNREGSFREEDATDPTGPTEGKTRIFRGGDASAPSRFCSAHWRSVADPDYKLGHKGFRLAFCNKSAKRLAPARNYVLNPPKPGEVRTVYLPYRFRPFEYNREWDSNLELRFHYCPKGTFLMGEGEVDAPRDPNVTYTDEPPVVTRIETPFWILETEVSQEMWECVMEYNPVRNKNWIFGSHPVTNVCLEDCLEFVSRLNDKKIAP